MTTTVLGRKCIACGHDNAPGDESCASCGSSLDLKLCPACEAINGAGADRCHACGDVFTSARGDESIDGKVLTVLREPYVTKSFARRRKRLAMFFGIVLGMLSLPVYLLISGMANRVAPAAEKQQAVGEQEVKTATVPPVKARADAPRTTEATGGIVPIAQAAPARQAGPVTGVTHTRRGDAPVAKTSSQERAAPEAPTKTATVSTEKAAAAAVVAQPASGDAAPAALKHPHIRVTHTRASAADAVVVPVAGVAGNGSSVSGVSASAAKARSSDCDEGIAALGLCNSKGKVGGNK
jgi:hypothetical protein